MDEVFFTKIEKKKKGKNHYMGVLIFEIKEEVEIKLNEKEIRDYRWIPFERFIHGSLSDLCYSKRNMKDFVKGLPQDSEIEQLNFPALNIGMEENLWGVTFYTTGVFVQKLMSFYRIDKLREEGFKVCEKYL